MSGERSSLAWRTTLVVGVTLITLFAGLKPEDYDFRNHAARAPDGIGLEFGRYGVAFSPRFLTRDAGGGPAREGLTIALTIGAEAARQDGFALIAQIRAADDRSQLIIGRWREHLIVMNGDDYDGRLRRPRITARSIPSRDEARTVAVTSGAGGTRIYVDGTVVSEKRDLALRLPDDPPGGRIVLGNSVSGTHPWKGTIRTFALYDRALDAGEIVALSRRGGVAPRDAGREGDRSPSPESESEPEGARVRYEMRDFVPGDPAIVPSRGREPVALQIPRGRVVVERRFLENPFAGHFDPNRGFFIDVLVNLLGFIPFGLALALLLTGLGVRGFRALLIVIAATAASSGGIEILQAWLPSRTSSILDLSLNIPSGCAGALIVTLGRRFADRRPGPGHDPGGTGAAGSGSR